MENLTSKLPLPDGLNPPPVLNQRPWFRSPRFITFIAVFLISAAAGLTYTYSRPAVYRCSATLLTTEMTAVDREGSGSIADFQHVAIQKQTLLGYDIINAVLARLNEPLAKASNPAHFSMADIRKMLDVVPIEETNLVEIRAEGFDPEILPLLINNWIDVYFSARAEEIKRSTRNTIHSLEVELAGLTDKIDKERSELLTFRSHNQILSSGRGENEALARLNGLTQSLNKALDDEVRARARLNAIKNAIANDETVVPQEDQGALQGFESRLQELREKQAELDKRFTRDYLNLQPTLKVIPGQIKKLEAEIKAKRRSGKNIVLVEAEKDYVAAQQTVREIRAQLNEHKQQAAKFTAKFAEYETKKNDLDGLEKLYRETKERLVQIETSHREKYPQVEVSSRAYLSPEPVRPNYGRDAVIALAGSLSLALFAVWIADYLTRKQEPSTPVVLSGIHMYPQAAELMSYREASLKPLERQLNKSLVSPVYRELSVDELKALLNVSTLKGKQIIGFLLSGLTLAEAASLKPEQFDMQAETISLEPPMQRTLRLNYPLKSLLAQSGGYPVWLAEQSRSPDDLAACLLCASLDSDLPTPLECNAEAIRHSYILYLVRQGLRLAELEQIVGHIDSAAIYEYSSYSPPQKGLGIGDIELVHPALAFS
jgi:succinoglycan biosynthesis transport protein ExoP